jgi:type II secretory pathway pseudopilin PulG
MRRRGFTLAEALMALVILTLVGGGILAIYAAGIRLFNRTSTFSQAAAAANTAAKGMASDGQEAMALKYATSLPAGERSSSTQLVLALPAKNGTTGYNLVPLQEGTWLRYYLSDKTGVYGNTGTSLWRGKKSVSEGVWRPEKRLADSVSALEFEYQPSLEKATLVAINVVTTARRGGKTVEGSATTEVLLRNVKE